MDLQPDATPSAIHSNSTRRKRVSTLARHQPAELTDLNKPALFINRELSWIEFNRRVLDEAKDPSNPLLERVKFLSIFNSNLDEFFMIRVSGLRQQVNEGVIDRSPDGLTPGEQLAEVYNCLEALLQEHNRLWYEVLRPELERNRIELWNYKNLSPEEQEHLNAFFHEEIFPTLTPLAFDPSHPFPHISNLSLSLAVVIDDPTNGERFARVKVPVVHPRLVSVPPVIGEVMSPPFRFVWIEDLISANCQRLFPGMRVKACYPFRVTRNTDIEIEQDEAADLLRTLEEGLRRRRFGSVVRLEAHTNLPERIRTILVNNLKVSLSEVYLADAPLGLSDLMELHHLDIPELKDPVLRPHVPWMLEGDDAFAVIRHQDILLHHPYESFTPVVELIKQAARDPHVLAIKQTLYRVGTNSPVVAALIRAAENGKQVAVLVELKARFDEENNIEWARALERAGVHVTYGLMHLKVHAKLALIVRREVDGIRRYIHLGTGNYNVVSARLYTDLGLLTTDRDMADDVTDLFNALTGYSNQQEYKKLLVAPVNLRSKLLTLIDEEIKFHKSQGNGHLIIKVNSLVDSPIIQKIYQASRAGVKVDLLVRGICALRPGMAGIGENIRVISIVGRFLEHSRIYYFYHGGAERMYLGSADLMQRNLDRRVEVLFPIDNPHWRANIKRTILDLELRDNVKARLLQSDGSYVRLEPGSGEPRINSQEQLIEIYAQTDDQEQIRPAAL
ncbi:MAG: polyphosphate kinase 1 [Chloroflexi bacterium]|nr:polyphosphate kinase 1 [Chloroflexota bacterium]